MSLSQQITFIKAQTQNQTQNQNQQKLAHYILLFLTTFIASIAFSDPSLQTYTRVADQVSGKMPYSEHGNVKGQDSLVYVIHKGKTYGFFGDTINGIKRMESNSMIEIIDNNASDGLKTIYSGPVGNTKEVLSPVKPEVTVWIMAAISHKDSIYAYYISIPPEWPNKPHLGIGIAEMKDGSTKFVRTNFYIKQGDPLFNYGLSTPTRSGGYLYFFAQKNEYYGARTTLVRVKEDQFMNRGAYEFYTTSGWSQSDINIQTMIDNSAFATVEWNKYLKKWMAVYSILFSDFGMSSEIGVSVSDNLTGPWTNTKSIYGLKMSGKWGASYGAARLAKFDRENGRVFYSTSTQSGPYNVFLQESQFGYGDYTGKISDASRDAHQEFNIKGQPSSKIKANSGRMGLDPKQKSIVAYNVDVTSFYPSSKIVRSRLEIPMLGKVKKATNIRLSISVGTPNDKKFTKLDDSLKTRTKISTVAVSLTLQPGDNKLVIQDALNDAITKAQANSNWKKYETNTLPIYITRTDSVNDVIQLGAFESSTGATLYTCYGSCK